MNITELRNTYLLAKTIWQDFVEKGRPPHSSLGEKVNFPPIVSEAFKANIYNTVGSNVLIVYLYKEYGIAYGPDAELVADAIPGCTLQRNRAGECFTLLTRSSLNEASVRELSKRIGLKGSHKTAITVEL